MNFQASKMVEVKMLLFLFEEWDSFIEENYQEKKRKSDVNFRL